MQKTKKILFYLYRFPGTGGIEKVTAVIANYLVSRGYEISICSHTGEEEHFLKKILDQRVQVYQMIDNCEVSSRNQGFLADLIKTNHIDIVVYQDCNSNIDHNIHSIQGKTPFKLVTVLHSSPNNPLVAFDYTWCPKGLFRRIIKPLSRLKLRYKIQARYRNQYNKSDAYVLLSDRFSSQWLQVAGLKKADKLVAINNPITIATPQSSQLQFAKENSCVFCGRLSSEKGIFLLLKAWRNIEAKRSDWNLIIIGDGAERANIETFIKENSLKNVELVGSVTDPSHYYSKAKIITMASYFEGWLLSLGEAMSFGCVPILFDSYLSVHDIVTDNVDGALVTPFDIEEYSTKLDSLMNDTNRLHKMSIEAFNSSKRFSIDNIGQQWENLFLSL